MGIKRHRLHRGQLGQLLQGSPPQILQAQQLFLLCQTGNFLTIQLNMYNFHKIRENNSESYFHHQCFDRLNEEKLVDIKRKPETKNSPRFPILALSLSLPSSLAMAAEFALDAYGRMIRLGAQVGGLHCQGLGALAASLRKAGCPSKRPFWFKTTDST